MYKGKEIALLKNRLENQLKKDSQLDFMKYCFYQVYFQDTLTDRKLKNHFSDDMIEKAKAAQIIVPWKGGYFFKAYEFCKEQFGQPESGKNPIMEDVDSLKEEIKKKENELLQLKMKYNDLIDGNDGFEELF